MSFVLLVLLVVGPAVAALLCRWLWRRGVRVLGWLVRRPTLLVVLAAVLWLTWQTPDRGPAFGVAIALGVIGVLVALRVLFPSWFAAGVQSRMAGWWREVRVYRGAWQSAMVTTGLALREGRELQLPRLIAVRTRGGIDLVRVRMLPGQVLEDWAQCAPRLAQTFGTQECRVRTVVRRKHDLDLWFLVTDPLAVDVPPFDVDTTDTTALPVGVREDGQRYDLSLLGTHVLVVGATGAGKGSVLWSIVAALGPALRDRTAQVWALDPKGGMELGGGRLLFERFVYGDPEDEAVYELDFARTLEDAVEVMRRRQSQLRGLARLHTPSPDEPLIVILVDELASLTAYVTDREAKRRIGSALALLLSQGRAVGISVVAAVQDPRKEVVTVRDLFPTRIALRLSEAEQVSLVLGAGARDRGARCDDVPESLPGIGYVGIDGVAEPVRVRFSHITDADITGLVARFRTAAPAVPAIEESAA
ncbi:FtsK/SpoIIIE domain-containing protein [Cellulomonas cellasea]|uniref:Cell division protein FtsK n=2 Tax=Cellulomonas cellasea TaxID=43670 RepID=A0A0A0B7T4_9CELL|nr:FtsK/SpoIIIE domain-containing protein [Cellulomonas cellasea]KGM02915.1 cell division protein FtsK [Cellulomonas cellasea DSM 20118]GEA89733.1 hypothetical cell division FtsK/SpoIIIE protein [Cellulomonas cellasea]